MCIKLNEEFNSNKPKSYIKFKLQTINIIQKFKSNKVKLIN
jgi:hypothetical protein